MSNSRSQRTGSANDGPNCRKPTVVCSAPDTGIAAKPYSTELRAGSAPASHLHYYGSQYFETCG